MAAQPLPRAGGKAVGKGERRADQVRVHTSMGQLLHRIPSGGGLVPSHVVQHGQKLRFIHRDQPAHVDVERVVIGELRAP